MNGPVMVEIYSNKMHGHGGLAMTNFGEEWFECLNLTYLFIVG